MMKNPFEIVGIKRNVWKGSPSWAETGGLLSQFLNIGQQTFQGRIGCSGVQGRFFQTCNVSTFTGGRREKKRDKRSFKIRSRWVT